MNHRSENQMRLVIVGASGMVGGYALRYMLDHPRHRARHVNWTEKAGLLTPQTQTRFCIKTFRDCSALAAADFRSGRLRLFAWAPIQGTVPGRAAPHNNRGLHN